MYLLEKKGREEDSLTLFATCFLLHAFEYIGTDERKSKQKYSLYIDPSAVFSHRVPQNLASAAWHVWVEFFGK